MPLFLCTIAVMTKQKCPAEDVLLLYIVAFRRARMEAFRRWRQEKLFEFKVSLVLIHSKFQASQD